jgi:ribosomal protein L7/L12
MPNFSSDQERQIREFINADQLIYAIKLYREITGSGLAEAKSAVEAMARGESVNLPAPQAQFDDPFVETRIREMLTKRNKIEAIKIYRETHRVGLKEAKDVIDGMEASMLRERRESVSMNTSDTSLPFEPAISNDPFAEDSSGNRIRLVVTVAILLLALGGAAVFFLMRGF